MADYTNIEKTLVDQLKTLPDLPQLILENEEGYLQSDDAVGTRTSSYVRTYMEPTRSGVGSIGVGGEDIYPVTFLIQLFSVTGKGTVNTNNFADDVIKLFARGKRLPFTNGCVDVVRAYRTGNVINTNYVQCTITIEAQSFIQRD